MSKAIVVATDFSARSDRAVRRATLLAKQFSRNLVLLHVVDDDQAESMIVAAENSARALLQDLVQTIRQVDGVPCESQVARGTVWRTVAQVGREREAGLVVLGPYRRELLTGIFGGTTAERTIREGAQPVLMANGTPTGRYRNIVFATDLSNCSLGAAEVVRRLGLERDTSVTVVHAFGSVTDTLLARSGMTDDQARHQQAHEAARAEKELAAFLEKARLGAPRIVVRAAGEPAEIIRTAARDAKADLIVVGTCSRTGLARLVIGSVAGDVLRRADEDVLVVPPS